jgi:hypothetical protein
MDAAGRPGAVLIFNIIGRWQEFCYLTDRQSEVYGNQRSRCDAANQLRVFIQGGTEPNCRNYIFCEPVTRGSWTNYMASVVLLKPVGGPTVSIWLTFGTANPAWKRS